LIDCLIVTEEQILAEYEARNRFDDEALCASVNRLTTDELICPVCTKLVQILLHLSSHLMANCFYRIDCFMRLDYFEYLPKLCSVYINK